MELTAVHLGASGFSYADWVGPFYPPGTKKEEFLAYYSQQFGALEINYTYYRLPTPDTMTRLLEKSGGRLRFAVKLTDLFTHGRRYEPADVIAFCKAMEPLAEAGVLGCLLAQFPHSFKPTRTQWAYLKELMAQFKAFPLVTEFRHSAWIKESFFEWLRERQIGFCCVDEPRLPGLLPPMDTVTSPVGYVRFHGRNEAKWWTHQRPEERYDYRYSARELAQWLPRLQKMTTEAEELYVFFNNHFEGKATDNARELLAMLERA